MAGRLTVQPAVDPCLTSDLDFAIFRCSTSYVNSARCDNFNLAVVQLLVQVYYQRRPESTLEPTELDDYLFPIWRPPTNLWQICEPGSYNKRWHIVVVEGGIEPDGDASLTQNYSTRSKCLARYRWTVGENGTTASWKVGLIRSLIQVDAICFFRGAAYPCVHIYIGSMIHPTRSSTMIPYSRYSF